MKYLLTGEETERLTFRLLEESDFDSWVKLFETEEAIKFLGLSNTTDPKELCRIWFDRVYKRYEEDRGGMNVLVEKSSGQFIGQCGLLVQKVDDKKELEIGYSILPQHWNKGFATEAAQKCRNEAFQNNYSNSLVSIIHVDNIMSRKVAENNGMYLDKTTTYREMQVDVFRIDKSDF